MKTIYLYLDDERKPAYKRENLVICKDYHSAIASVKALVTDDVTEFIVDLDHDLGTKKTGYDFCKWLIEKGYIGFFHIHSANPVGAFNMRQLLTRYGWVEI